MAQALAAAHVHGGLGHRTCSVDLRVRARVLVRVAMLPYVPAGTPYTYTLPWRPRVRPGTSTPGRLYEAEGVKRLRFKPDYYYEKIAATCDTRHVVATCDSDGRFILFCRKSSATSGKHTCISQHPASLRPGFPMSQCMSRPMSQCMSRPMSQCMLSQK